MKLLVGKYKPEAQARGFAVTYSLACASGLYPIQCGVDGSTLVATSDIQSYDWMSHTITLKDGRRDRLLTRLLKRNLVRGYPFRLVVQGKTIYEGIITTGYSSCSFDAPVIDLTPNDLGPEQIRIQLGYPTQQFFKSKDPRGNRGIREALARARKLSRRDGPKGASHF